MGSLCIPILLILCITIESIIYVNSEVQPINEGPTQAPLGCYRRLYTYRIAQVDSKGRECWDNVQIYACWGRCDSSEISDWKFPYKKSHHPVCMYDSRAKAVAYLRNCHPEVEEKTRRYEYLEASDCKCHTCPSTDTSCEAPHNILNENTSIKFLTLTGENSSELDY